MKKLYSAIIITGVSQGLVSHLNYAVLNMIEPFTICWLSRLKYGLDNVDTFSNTTLDTSSNIKAASTCENAFDDFADDLFSDITPIWSVIRGIFGWSAALSCLLAQPLVDKYAGFGSK